MSLVYTAKIFCKLCNADVLIHLYSDEINFEMTEERRKELLEHVDHMHWCHHHRLCAICGNVVDGGDLDLLVRLDFKGEVNENYINWLKYPDHGLLIIHKKCLEKI